MASSTMDYFSDSRTAVRPRQTSNLGAVTPGSPRTPLLGRSISGQFGSPGTPFRSEQEDFVVYELGARHLSAGFAGESRPRCVLGFSPEDGRRAGDFRSYNADYVRPVKRLRREEDWGAELELYRTDIRTLDLGLVEDKLERAVHKVHADFLQLPNKPLKAVLAVPSLLPTPLLELALKVLFNHYAQPPSVIILSTPILSCVSAGLRNALVVDIGWEETVVTAVGEYKEISQRRSIRAGRMFTREMARVLEREIKSQLETGEKDEGNPVEVDFNLAEDVTRRMGWCRPRRMQSAQSEQARMVQIPLPLADRDSTKAINVFFTRLSEPAESTLLSQESLDSPKPDDHETPIQDLIYNVLLALPVDLRKLCMSRITFTGGLSALPGLKHRLLQELHHIVETRSWDPICSYGSAAKHHSRILAERSANIAAYRTQRQNQPQPEELARMKEDQRNALPPHARPHDDVGDQLTARAERHAVARQKDASPAEVSGVSTWGPWAGASLIASLRIKGVREVDRDEFLRHGMRDVSVPGL